MIRKKGTHTWDLYLHYEKCPACEFIFENRTDFRYLIGKWIKNLRCPRCGEAFQIEKDGSSIPIGPIFGDPPKPEFDWSE